MTKLSDSEWVIMKILWNNSDCSQSTISIAAINYNINWSRNTVHTLLNRLINKKAVEADKTVKPYIYFAVIKWEECSMSETTIFFNRVFDDSITKMFSTVLSSQMFTKDDLYIIKRIADRYYAKACYEMRKKLKSKELYQKRKNRLLKKKYPTIVGALNTMTSKS